MQVWLLQVKFPLTAVLCCHNIAKQYQPFVERFVGAANLRGVRPLVTYIGGSDNTVDS